MANENMDDRKAAPGIVMETVKAAKSFIEAELGKYGTWEEFSSSVCGGTILPMIDNGQAFAKVKGAGPGIETIHAFLGKQWSRYLIENTLSVIRQEETAERAKEEREKRSSPFRLVEQATLGVFVGLVVVEAGEVEVTGDADILSLSCPDHVEAQQGGNRNEDGGNDDPFHDRQ